MSVGYAEDTHLSMDVAATPLIIEQLQKKGYRFVTVPELLTMRRHSILSLHR